MAAIELQAEVRASRGKGSARRLRVEGKVPAVIYGVGVEPTALTIEPKALLGALQSERGRNTRIDVIVDGTTHHALVRDVAVHPTTRVLEHVDFYKISLDQVLDFEVPFVTKGRALGVQKGGKLRNQFRSLPVRATVDNVPERIELDVTSLDSGKSITAAEIPVGEGVEISLKPAKVIVFIEVERVVEVAAPAADAKGKKGKK